MHIAQTFLVMGQTLMLVHFGDLLVCQNERSTVCKFADIACLAEEVIINSPLQFNPIHEKSWHYDVSEAYALLEEFKVVEEEHEFNKAINSSHCQISYHEGLGRVWCLLDICNQEHNSGTQKNRRPWMDPLPLRSGI